MFGLSAGKTTLADQESHDSEELVSHRARLQRWMVVAGLSKDWEIEKLRWANDPSPIAMEDHKALLLELRFLFEGMDQAGEDKRFQQSLEAYQSAHGEAAPERIFYKLIHECHVSRQEAVVTFRVLQRDYVVFFDPAIGEPRMQLKTDRSYSTEVPLELPGIATGRQTLLRAATVPDRRALSGLIETFVREYFTAANHKANLATPKFDPDNVQNRDHDHVGFTISGVKSQILTSKKYWEQIEISLDMVQAPSGLKLLCHIDGYYASGIGPRLPDDDAYEDMRKGFQGQLITFTDGFLSQLQKRIEKGS